MRISPMQSPIFPQGKLWENHRKAERRSSFETLLFPTPCDPSILWGSRGALFSTYRGGCLARGAAKNEPFRSRGAN